jgi:hypothetical protein
MAPTVQSALHLTALDQAGERRLYDIAGEPCPGAPRRHGTMLTFPRKILAGRRRG